MQRSSAPSSQSGAESPPALDGEISDVLHSARVALVGAIANSITHELMQPLSAIKLDAFSCLQWNTGAQPDPAEARSALARITGEIDRVVAIFETIRLLLVSQPEVRTQLSLRDSLRQAILLLRQAVCAKRVDLRVTMAEDLPDIIADAPQMIQLMLGLLASALDSVGRSDEALKWITVDGRIEGDCVVMLIAQSASHYPDAPRNTISDTRYEPDAISRLVAEHHGGSLLFGGSEDAAMVLRLPVAPPRTRLPARSEALASQPGSVNSSSAIAPTKMVSDQ